MSAVTPAQLARHIRKKKNVLIMAGYQCDEMELGERKLADYVADLAQKLDAPVAATGNSVLALKAKGARAAKKVAMEMVEMLRYPGWRDPIIKERPDLLLFVGYPRDVARGLVTAAKGVDTAVLGPGAVDEATYCFADATLAGYQRNLETLVGKLGA